MMTKEFYDINNDKHSLICKNCGYPDAEEIWSESLTRPDRAHVAHGCEHCGHIRTIGYVMRESSEIVDFS